MARIDVALSTQPYFISSVVWIMRVKVSSSMELLKPTVSEMHRKWPVCVYAFLHTFTYILYAYVYMCIVTVSCVPI